MGVNLIDLKPGRVEATDNEPITVASVLRAHSPNASGTWHQLADHLESVARLGAGFGQAFGAAEVCRFVGHIHDLGKADPAWQAYLVAAARGEKRPTVDHKTAAAFLCQQWGVTDLAFVVFGHHGGLPAPTQPQPAAPGVPRR